MIFFVIIILNASMLYSRAFILSSTSSAGYAAFFRFSKQRAVSRAVVHHFAGLTNGKHPTHRRQILFVFSAETCLASVPLLRIKICTAATEKNRNDQIYPRPRSQTIIRGKYEQRETRIYGVSAHTVRAGVNKFTFGKPHQQLNHGRCPQRYTQNQKTVPSGVRIAGGTGSRATAGA